MKNNPLLLSKNVKLLLKPLLCILALALITFSCKKETNTVTPKRTCTYTAADVAGKYTILKSEWPENPLGIGRNIILYIYIEQFPKGLSNYTLFFPYTPFHNIL